MTFGAKKHGPFETLRADIDDTLDPAYDRERNIRNFFQTLRFGTVTVNDWQSVVARMSSGSAFGKHDVLPNASELLSALSESERAHLKEHYFSKLNAILQEFPNLKDEFPEQFRG